MHYQYYMKQPIFVILSIKAYCAIFHCFIHSYSSMPSIVRWSCVDSSSLGHAQSIYRCWWSTIWSWPWNTWIIKRETVNQIIPRLHCGSLKFILKTSAPNKNSFHANTKVSLELVKIGKWLAELFGITTYEFTAYLTKVSNACIWT